LAETTKPCKMKLMSTGTEWQFQPVSDSNLCATVELLSSGLEST